MSLFQSYVAVAVAVKTGFESLFDVLSVSNDPFRYQSTNQSL